MGPWPFDRLVRALGTLAADHDVFVQTGTSTVVPPCPHAPEVGPDEVGRRVAEADVVVTHAGNTVRLVQRAGKVPVAVAREAARGEMRNDHQVDYLRREVPRGRVVALSGELADLPAVVAAHPAVSRAMLAAAGPLPVPDPAGAGALLDGVLRAAGRGGPFGQDPTARYAWAYAQLAGRTGRHLDLGVGDGVFTSALAALPGLQVVGVDAHAGYLRALGERTGLPLVRVREPLPFVDGAFDSVSALDALEHTPDDGRTLAELARVLRPGGLLVLTVPALGPWSLLDPDNAKLRHPRLHGAVYRARYGRATYAERFADLRDGLRGDLDVGRTEHTNYRPVDLLAALRAVGLEPVVRDGANLFWRLFQVPRLLGPAALARPLDAALRLDGRHFARANLFLATVRVR